MRSEEAKLVEIAKEISEQIAETQQLIQLSRQASGTVDQTQSPDDRFSERPYFDPVAKSCSS